MAEKQVIGPVVINRITSNLREFGYADVTPEEVAEQLSRPESDRDIIGMYAADMLRQNGVTEWTVEYP